MPSCTVFPDYPGAPSPPPQPRPTAAHSAAAPPAAHDFFNWRAASPSADLSAPAPSPLLDPGFLPSHDATLGAWYAFAHAFDSPLGAAAFADQALLSARADAARRRGEGEAVGRASARRRGRVRGEGGGEGGGGGGGGGGGAGSADSGVAGGGRHLEHVGAFGWDDVNAEQEDNEDEEESWSEEEEGEDGGSGLWSRRMVPGFGAGAVYAGGSERDGAAGGDITAEQAASGTDVQGIPWESLPFSRNDYRASRLREVKRTDTPSECAELKDMLKEPRKGAQFYDFFRNTRRVKCSIVHFQLRNLAWATSKHDVFVVHDAGVVHWDAAAKRKTQVLDLSGSGTAGAAGLGMVQISTMIAKDDLVIAGGFYGEMVAKNLKTGTIIHNKRITYDENAITNAIDIFQDSIMTSNNDCYVRCFDMETFQKKASFGFTLPVNHATRQPGGKMVAVAGDDKPIVVIDGDSGVKIAQLHGHEHFSFATGWHPNGRMFATGSQDKTCRVWDVRNMSQSFSVLGATGAVRSLRFTACGQYLMMAEPRDFVHIYDINRGEFDTCQEIDLFGEIAGIALTPSAEGLFIAVSDRTYSSLIEYERSSKSGMSDLML